MACGGVGPSNLTQPASPTSPGNSPFAGVFTQRYDNGRTGANTQEVLLTPSNVTESRFGRLFSLPTDGQAYAQPLYMENVSIPNQGVHNVVFVATQHDSVYAFDADSQSTTPLWHVSFVNTTAGVTTVPCQDVYGAGPGDCDISPEIGITSTPVIDPTGGTLYVTAKTREPLGSNSCSNNGTYNYCYRLHALDITTGVDKFGGPVMISANVPGTGYDSVSGTVTFTALYHLQRPGLLLLNGTIYVGFGSHGDDDPYHGWLMAYNATTLQQVAVFNVTPNGQRGAIWQAGGGISADPSGSIYIVTSNGTFDANATGGVDYGDSGLKMQLQSGKFQVMDYFTPANQAVLSEEDLDLGSSPAMILPDQPGPNPHLLATGGKDGRIWLVNRDNLGHLQANDGGAVQVIPDGSDGLFGGGTYWNGNLYVQEKGDFLKQFPLQNGMAQSPTSSAFQVGYPNPAPVVSANGTNNAVLWLVEADAFRTGGPAVLRAFDASDVTNEIYDSTQAPNQRDQAGPAVKFVVPTIANGKVYVGAAGEVDVYGLLP
ncbi:MAG TPA: pyrrolo-quinoline quinone [Terriglobia bacterium]|nr:pyrrolo-quinoline quinone [Terriglobia bacterium]